MNQPLAKQVVAEFVGTFTLIFIGIGAIFHLGSVPGGLLGIALAHGLAIAVMVSATGAISGGHLNLVGGKIDFPTTVAYWIAQCAGGTIAALAAGHLIVTGDAKAADIIINGTPALGKGVSVAAGIGIEAVLTFFLVFVVYGTAVDARAPKVGGLFIGLTVALDILFGGPLTGGAMNVARWLGPALATNHFDNAIVYIAGPLLGGAAAGLIYGRFLIKQN
ncbi:MAG: aquaporin [Verrucomicrobia bacterium]|nr:aquaporin [Verrucomicrobiota bacterium]